MVLRGLISPPRSRSSPRDFRPNNNAAANPPSRPNYTSPSRRPTAADQHTPSHRKPTANAIRAAKKSPPRVRPKPASPVVPSRRPTAPHNPTDLQNQKKLDGKTTAKIPGGKQSPSPRTQQQRPRNGVEQQPRGATQILKNTTPRPKPKSVIASGSPAPNASANNGNLIFDSPNNNSSPTTDNHFSGQGSGQRQDFKNQSPDSSGACNSLGDHPQLNNHLQRSSISGKDIANIILHAHSICESVGSDTNEEAPSSSSQSNASRIFRIYKDIASYRQGSSTITAYFTKLKTFWDELETYGDLPQCSCGAVEKLSERVEREKVMQFLMGLDDSYSSICPQILLIQPFPTVEKAYSAVIREEKRRELVLSLEMVAEKVMQNKWLLQNDQSSNGDNNVEEHQVDQNGGGTMMPPSMYDNLEDVEIPSFPNNEPLLIDLGSPVRC